MTWVRFVVWLVIGMAIYFAYGRRHSRLNERFSAASTAVNGTAAPESQPDDRDEYTRA